jgi:hypothetical protein
MDSLLRRLDRKRWFKEEFTEIIKRYGLEDPEGRAEAAYKCVYAGLEGSGQTKITVNPEFLASLTKEENALITPLLGKLVRTLFRETDQLIEKVVEARILAEHEKIMGEWLQRAEVPDDFPKN